jgi:pyruvate dehydrogenase kinase 2/3/4
LLDHYSRFHPSVLSIQQFIDFGTKDASAKQSFLFLRKELPVRLANIMKEIRLLPEPLQTQPSVQHLTGWFEQSFVEILDFEKSSPDDAEVLKRFHVILDTIRNRHKTVVETMAQGVIEMKDKLTQTDYSLLDGRIQYFLDRFYMNRISLRMLIHQHLLLFSDTDNHPRHIGCIDPACDVLSVAEDAFDSARFLCEQYYNTAPVCQFRCLDPASKSKDTKDARITMTYVPSHLYHILFELLKNSMRAIVEYHSNDGSLPPVNVLIVKGREDVIIKVSDEGGGIPRSEIDKLFHYMYSTAPQPPSPDALDTTPLAGYGYGLPLSRLYAKYFNGDLWLNSVDGYGTDATIFLKLLPCDASELLPIFNKTSLLRYTTARQVGDWSDPNYSPNSTSSDPPSSSSGSSGTSTHR